MGPPFFRGISQPFWMSPFLFALCLFALSCFVQAKGLAETIQERFGELQRTSELAQAKVAKLHAELDGARERLAVLQKKKEELTTLEAELQSLLDSVANRLLQLDREVEQLTLQTVKLKARQLERLRTIDRLEPSETILQVFSQQERNFDYDDFLLLASRMQEQENSLVEEIRSTVLLLSLRRKEEETLLEKQRGIHKKIRTEREEISKVVVEKQQVEADLRRREVALKKEVMSLQAEALRLETVLSSLASEATAEDREERKHRRVLVETSSVQQPQFQRGKLLVPVKGSIARKFGKGERADPLRNGVLFRSVREQAVQAVAPGKVSFIGKLPYFGTCLILEHGEDEFSLYGGIKKIASKLADRVERGESLGYLPENLELYFELRDHGKPVNPEPLFEDGASK